MYSRIFLKSQKEKPILQKHHWIFSGAVASKDRNLKAGDIVAVYSSDTRFLGYGFYHPSNSISVRMINFDDVDPIVFIKNKIKESWVQRSLIFDNNVTNAYRIINSEGDGLSGLTVDRYDSYLVMQISSFGFERIKDIVVQELLTVAKDLGENITLVYEKSNNQGRRSEGLEIVNKILYSAESVNDVKTIKVLENNLLFEVDVVNGQKTGLFLDMREMRSLIGSLAGGKKILNCFGYNGGFSVYAAKNNAHTTTVDISKHAINSAQQNFILNNIPLENHKFIAEDVFEFVSNQNNLHDYDIVILDPPAFAKKREDVPQATKAYKKLNYLVFQKVKPNTLVLTCSCSYHVSSDMFEKAVFDALRQSNKSGRIISKHRQALDHPINVFHPENEYLKSLLMYVF